MTGRQTRAERMAMPMTRNSVAAGLPNRGRQPDRQAPVQLAPHGLSDLARST